MFVRSATPGEAQCYKCLYCYIIFSITVTFNCPFLMILSICDYHVNPLPHPKRVCEGLWGLTLPDVPAFCLAKRPPWCESISSLFISPPSAPSSPEYRMVAIAIMSARPGGWTPSPRPCFAFAVRPSLDRVCR